MIVYRTYFGIHIYELGNKETLQTFWFASLTHGYAPFVDKVIDDIFELFKKNIKKGNFETKSYGPGKIAIVRPKEYPAAVGFFFRRRGNITWRFISWGFLVGNRYGQQEISEFAKKHRIYVWW